MNKSITQPHATILAAVIMLAGAVLGHYLVYLGKERDRAVKR